MDKIKIEMKEVDSTIKYEIKTNVVQKVTIEKNGVKTIYERDKVRGDYYCPDNSGAERIDAPDLVEFLKEGVTKKTKLEIIDNEVDLNFKGKGVLAVKSKINQVFGAEDAEKDRFVLLGHCYAGWMAGHYYNEVRGNEALRDKLVNIAGLNLVDQFYLLKDQYSSFASRSQKKQDHFVIVTGDNDIDELADDDDLPEKLKGMFSAKTFERNFEDLIRSIKSEDPASIIVFGLPAPPDKKSALYKQEMDGQKIDLDIEDWDEMIAIQKKVCDRNGVTFVPVPKELEGKVIIRAEDGWHLTEKGYKQLFKFIINESCKQLGIKGHPMLKIVNDPNFVLGEGLRGESLEATEGLCFEESEGKKTDMDINNYVRQFLAGKNSDRGIG